MICNKYCSSIFIVCQYIFIVNKESVRNTMETWFDLLAEHMSLDTFQTFSVYKSKLRTSDMR
jgi:hypothetical protein